VLRTSVVCFHSFYCETAETKECFFFLLMFFFWLLPHHSRPRPACTNMGQQQSHAAASSPARAQVQATAFLDPRSPNHEIPRTPLRGFLATQRLLYFGAPQGLDHTLPPTMDPRSPSQCLARTPLVPLAMRRESETDDDPVPVSLNFEALVPECPPSTATPAATEAPCEAIEMLPSTPQPQQQQQQEQQQEQQPQPQPQQQRQPSSSSKSNSVIKSKRFARTEAGQPARRALGTLTNSPQVLAVRKTAPSGSINSPLIMNELL
jgi:hypothetical protein